MEANTNKPALERYPRLLFWLSVSATAYFIVMNFLGVQRANFQIIQVIIELFTLPMLLVAMGCFVFAGIFWVRERFNLLSRSFYSLVLMSLLFIFFIFAS
jgi:hypothetical protein